MLRAGAMSAQSVLRRMGIRWRLAMASPLGNGIGSIYDAHPELAAALSPAEMIWSHTLAPLFAVLGPAVESPEAISGFADAVLLKGAWRARNPVCGNLKATGLRECSACREADIREYGVSYWHREHQISPVSVCWRHGTRLQQHSWHPGAGFEFELPGFGRYAQRAHEVQYPGKLSQDLEMWIAQSFVELLDNARDVDSVAVHAQLCEMACARGLMPRSRPSRRGVFEQIISAYGPLYLEHLGLPTVFSMPVALRYVRPLRLEAPQDVVVTVLLAGALGRSVAWLAKTPAEEREEQASAHVAANGRDAELEACLERAGYIFNRAQVALGINRHQLIQRILRAGIVCPIAFGSNAKFDEAGVRQMIQDLRSGKSRQDVATAYECSPSFIDQLVIYDPELRQIMKQHRHGSATVANRHAFEQYVRETAGVTRSGIRKDLPGPMSYLKRNDGPWLKERLAKIPRQVGMAPGAAAGRGRVLDEETDQSVLSKLREAMRLLNALTPPRRCTPTLMLRLAGVRLSMFVKLSAGRLPLTQALLEEVTESELAFVRRRIEYAVTGMAQERCALTADALRRASGLALPKLKEYRALVRDVAAAHHMPISHQAAPWLAKP